MSSEYQTLDAHVEEAGIDPKVLNPSGYPCEGCGRVFPAWALSPLDDDSVRCACCLIDAQRHETPAFELTWNDVRGERATELAKTDWTQMPDIPEPLRKRWQEYRQAWRDITLQDCHPADVVRPNPPE